MVEGKFLRSPYAHARIRAIDTRDAEALPGVIAVLTSKDFTDIEPYIGRGKNKDQPIIAIDRSIYAGQPVAAVAALDRTTAEAALSLIQVDYEELPAVIDVDEAIADGAPRMHDFAERNICATADLVKGDVEKGFAESDEIFEDTFEFPMIYHYSMEPHTAIAQVETTASTFGPLPAIPSECARKSRRSFIFRCRRFACTSILSAARTVASRVGKSSRSWLRWRAKPAGPCA